MLDSDFYATEGAWARRLAQTRHDRVFCCVASEVEGCRSKLSCWDFAPLVFWTSERWERFVGMAEEGLMEELKGAHTLPVAKELLLARWRSHALRWHSSLGRMRDVAGGTLAAIRASFPIAACVPPLLVRNWIV